MPITRAQLIADGCTVNPNMWIGSGFFHCPTCGGDRRHEALSHTGAADCYEVCLGCGLYHGRESMRAQIDAAREALGLTATERYSLAQAKLIADAIRDAARFSN